MSLTVLEPYKYLKFAWMPTSPYIPLVSHNYQFLLQSNWRKAVIILDKYTDCHAAVNLLGDKVFLLQRTVNTSCVSNYICLLREGGIFLSLQGYSFRRNNKKRSYDCDTEPTKQDGTEFKD